MQNTYNDLNRLVQTTVGGVSTNYAYDINGLRSAKNDTTYLYDGNDLVVEMEDGTLVGRYMYGLALNSAVINGEDIFYLRNAHGDVAMLTDMEGAIIKTYDYDAFGNEINPDPNDANPLRYAGEYYDKETGTYYLRARYYDPVIGRFTQEDPHWNQSNMLYGDDPLKLNNYTYAPSLAAIIQSGNLYVYAMSNPTRYADPDGESIAIAAISLKAAGAGILNGLAVGAAYKYSGKSHLAGFFNGFASEFGSSFGQGFGFYVGGPSGSYIGTLVGGALGSAIGSLADDLISNNGKSINDMAQSAAKSAAESIVMGLPVTHLEYVAALSKINDEAAIVTKELMKYDQHFGKAMKTFFEVFSKALSYAEVAS